MAPPCRVVVTVVAVAALAAAPAGKGLRTEHPTAHEESHRHADDAASGDACDEMCFISEVGASCKDHIQRSSLVDFLGESNSCDLALELVTQSCSNCARCPAKKAGCGVLEMPSTKPPTTTLPAGGACEASCELGGQAALCKDRILWSATNYFTNKPDACKSAHSTVLGQCPVCGGCALQGLGCMDEETRQAEQKQRAEAEAARAAAESAVNAAAVAGSLSADDDTFDCTADAKTWVCTWSRAKKDWCCEHQERGCDKDAECVVVKFDAAGLQSAAGRAGATWNQRRHAAAVAGGSLLALGGFVVLFAVGRAHSRRAVAPQRLLQADMDVGE